MKPYENFTDFKEFPVTTKKGKKSKIKIFSSYLILDKKKYEFKDISNWCYTSRNLFFFILGSNRIKYFTTSFCKSISNELKEKCDCLKKDQILMR